MKKFAISIMAILVLSLFFSGCATTSEAEAGSQLFMEQTPARAKGQQKAVEVKKVKPLPEEKASGPEVGVSQKEVRNKGIDVLFDETEGWPENIQNEAVPMNRAEDDLLWDGFIELAESGAPAEELEAYLIEWFADYGWTPEFYAACHNYFFIKSSDILNTAVTEEDIQKVYDYFDKCFAATLHGGMQYPDRLDLWCGYVHAANLLGFYESAAECCMTIFNRLEYNANNWYWTYSEPFYGDQALFVREDEFVGIMHDYICNWLEVENGLDYALPVAEKLVEYFPENPIGLNDAGYCRMLNGEVEKARGYFERAHDTAPDDMLIIQNLAYITKELGDYESSGKYADFLIHSEEPEYVDCGIRLMAELIGITEER